MMRRTQVIPCVLAACLVALPTWAQNTNDADAVKKPEEVVLTVQSKVHDIKMVLPLLKQNTEGLHSGEFGVNDALQKLVMAAVLEYSEPYDKTTVEGGYKITFQDDKTVSVLLDFYSYMQGAAHPNTYSVTLTYDLENNQPLTLESVLGEKAWTTKLHELVKPKLVKHFAEMDSAMDETKAAEMVDSFGFEPKADVFADWNVTPNGLAVRFDPYAVAPYVYGAQTIQIPFAEVKQAFPKAQTFLAPCTGKTGK